MSRDIGPEIRETDRIPERPKKERQSREGRSVPERDRAVLSERQRETLYDIGRFRTVAVEDLVTHRYQKNAAPMREDLRALLAQGLVQRRTALVAQGRQKLAVLVLTKAGVRTLEARRDDSAQALYAGFVKPGEVAHDAAIYRMFHKEAEHLEKQGATLRRVVLDYELKRKIYAPLAKERHLPPLEYARRQAQVASENGLKVVDGKIPLPDLRIEYMTADGDLARVDLELATHHYHGSHLQTKAEAGFKMYAADGSEGRARAVLEEREITATILSL